MSDTDKGTKTHVQTRAFRLALSMRADDFRDLYEIAMSEGCSTSELASKALEEWVAEKKKLRNS